MQKTILLSLSLMAFTALAATPKTQTQDIKPTQDLTEVLKRSRCIPNRDTTTGEINGYRCLDQKGNLKDEFITADGRRVTFDDNGEAPTQMDMEQKAKSRDAHLVALNKGTASDDYQIQLKRLNTKKVTNTTRPGGARTADSVRDVSQSRPRPAPRAPRAQSEEVQQDRAPASDTDASSTRLDTTSISKPIIPQKINVSVELNRIANNTNMQMRQDVVLTEGKPISIQGRSPSNKRMVIQLAATIPDKTQPNSIQVSSRIYEYVNGKPVLISAPRIMTLNNTEASAGSGSKDDPTSLSLKVKPTIITE